MSTPLPSLIEMSTWDEDEIQAAIIVFKPPEWRFEFELLDGWWNAEYLDAAGEVIFRAAHPDPRLALFDAYGHVWHLHFKPSHPKWERRRDDLREVARHGLMGLPGAENVPDPEDLDPESVYGDDPTRRTR